MIKRKYTLHRFDGRSAGALLIRICTCFSRVCFKSVLLYRAYICSKKYKSKPQAPAGLCQSSPYISSPSILAPLRPPPPADLFQSPACPFAGISFPTPYRPFPTPLLTLSRSDLCQCLPLFSCPKNILSEKNSTDTLPNGIGTVF